LFLLPAFTFLPRTTSSGMSVGASVLPLSSVWFRHKQELQHAGDVEWAGNALLSHVRGQPIAADQQEALEGLSEVERAILAAKSGPALTAAAQSIISADLDQLSISSHVDIDAVGTLSRISSVYTRWTECLELLGNGTPSSLPVWIRVKVENLGGVIERNISKELGACRSSNTYQISMQSMGLEGQWNAYVVRASRQLALERVRAIEQEVDNFHEAALPRLRVWLERSLLSTLSQWQVQHIESIHSRLDYEMCIELGQIRSRQLFDIITDFPLSSPALEDLNVCGEQSNLQPYTSRQLSLSLQARLLHPGASTRDIIQFYTHLIRALRFIDQSGVILSHVIGPVGSYLRARADTISVIVASLLGQAGDFTLLRDMMRETGESHGLGAADTSIVVYDDEAEEGPRQAVAMNHLVADESARMVVLPSADEIDWAPRPVNAGPDYRQSRKSDVIAIIVSIFDDEEGFVAALEKSCAEQLVKVKSYDTSKEYETNENLKKRFGDAPLSRCDVMLNDIKKSQRYNRSIQNMHSSSHSTSQVSPAFKALHPFILSRQFWPPMKETAPLPTQATSTMFGSAAASTASTAGSSFSQKSVKMPGQFAKALDQYSDAFKATAPMRRIRWLNARESVSLELEMDDGRRIKERVNPVQAAVVEVAAGMSASQKQPMTISLLVSELDMDEKTIMQAVYFWISRGVLKATEADPSSFVIGEERD
jgi:hypothetical protein